MRKKKVWLLLALVVLCAAVAGLYYYHTQSQLDHTAPVISVESEEISLSVNEEQDACLDGVSAWDETDGDVTDLLVVESISPISAEHCVTVTYAAFDNAGNVAKAQRTIRYVDYEGPKFDLSAGLVFSSGYTIDLLDYVSAIDPIDGDLSDRVKATLSGGGSDLSEEGTHMVDLRVTNSMGDTERITVPVEVYDYSDYNATVNLSDYLIYLEVGDYFDAEKYLENLYAGYREIGSEQLAQEDAHIDIRSDVDPDVPGTYSVTYAITYKNYTGFTRMIVVVEE